MLNKPSCFGIAIFLIFSIPLVHGDSHERYEKFIPLGYSPGLSEKYTTIGSIVATDEDEKTVTVSTDSESHIYRVNENTKIWLDRSQIKARNLDGSFTDLKEGLNVEIRTDPAEDKAVAKWIKVQITNH
ncbi:conserved hypothetical protein [Nitrosococcus halophilus Nc 4]|uniref:DUF5666 domain-containing protein n=1 Tax=Nitrosococcus halophilus (strain Nc4) TaxID=472759 RepID=D5C0H4_NITHN|nr:hypothetical protein [Nitrosococcus halophilus]ADE14500.1 conserved hypothetical protein [Nitrosococcus halophilus Nc 4]